MNIKLLVVGHIKEKYMSAAISDYVLRLSKYCSVDIVEVKEENDTNVGAKEKEGKRLLERVKLADYVVALTLNAAEFDSVTLSKHLEKTFIKANSQITIIIGGSLGLSSDVIKRANECWTLSKLTFTHQMTRLIILEQLYRAFKIMHHEKYHK